MAGSSNSIVSVAASGNAAAAGGSVIDVSTLVSQLVAATRAPRDKQLASQNKAVTTKISAMGALKSALSTFQSALKPLSTTGSFAAVTASTSDAKVASATADPGAVSGSYAVSVSALASAQQILSGPFAGGAAATVGTGALSLQLGTSAFSVTIDAASNTLGGIAAAINSATDNPGIAATVIQGTDGAHLLLAASQTGAANTIQVAETDGGGGLAALTYAAGNPGGYTQVAAAQDAAFTVAGVAYTSTSNAVSDAISGLTLNLAGVSVTPAIVTVRSDAATVTKNIQAFAEAYNTLQNATGSLASYDSASGTAGPLLGDTLLTGVQSGLRKALYSSAGTGTYNSLASIGITTQKDGTLAIDDARLRKALAAGFGQVSQLFTGAAGVATQLNTTLTQELASGGPIDTRNQNLGKQTRSLSDQLIKLDQQMASLTGSLTQQYSALNALLSSLRTTSAYLSQAIDSLPAVQSKKG
jgi:flagellar hook-associated protein 2